MRTAIVTGANGFVGTWLVRELVSHQVEVWAVIKDEKENTAAIEDLPGVHTVCCALDALKALPARMEARGFDAFYNLAWAGSAGVARKDERLQLQNALWTADALRSAKALGCKKFVNAGSIMEKETVAAIFAQDSQPGLAYIYGAGKLLAHSLCKPIANAIGMPLVWAMITNAYGEGERSPRFINTTIRRIINREPLRFTAATQNYDFVHVEDVARALYLIGEYGKANRSYLIGSGHARPLREFIVEMQQTLAPEAQLLFGDIPFTGVNMPLADFSTADTEADTGFRAKIPFAEGIERTMAWIREQEA